MGERASVAFELLVTLPLGMVAFEVGLTLLLALVLKVAGDQPFGVVGLSARGLNATLLHAPVALKIGMTFLFED